MDHSTESSSEPGHPLPMHQRHVDEMVAAIRAETPAARPNLFKPAPPRPQPSERLLDHRIAAELQYIARQLHQLGNILSEEPILVVRHSGSMQSIDLIKQSLSHLAQVVAAQDKEAVADKITLSELKGRLRPKTIRPLADDGFVGKQ